MPNTNSEPPNTRPDGHFVSGSSPLALKLGAALGLGDIKGLVSFYLSVEADEAIKVYATYYATESQVKALEDIFNKEPLEAVVHFVEKNQQIG